MKNKEQKYATKKFYSLNSAESFKAKVNSNFNITTHKSEKAHLGDTRIVYHVRFKIDKNRSKNKVKVNNSYSEYWNEANLDGSFAYNGVTDNF